MAITLPAGCYLQPDDSGGKDANNAKTRSYPVKGGYDDLEALMNSLSAGDEVLTGWVLSTANIQRRPGDTGVLTLNCTSKDTTTSDDQIVQKSLDETWTIKSVRNDVSILGYCGGGADNPCREWIEAWQKEPDGTIAAAYGFTKSSGEVFYIPNQQQEGQQNRATATVDLIAKIKDGIESVMRFYPMITKTRTYSTPPLKVYENLSEINTPEIGTTADTERLKKPGNLDEIIRAHSWLKCQDDCAFTADAKWQRIESWMGVLNGRGGWDQNLYGDSTMNRWPMPYSHTQNAQS